ncbi:MAG: radical SAM family heme chaperone HemW [Bradymonadaceae bacterium]|nr:radical SAM family heme chaperone HemW [Lujinxingiaceae bacterium]
MQASPKQRRDQRAGVYIHVPFCARLCPYCDFAVSIKAEIPHRAYAEALLAEFAMRAQELEGRDVRTIYVGGGTPSLWDRGELSRVLDVVRERLGVAEDVEVTLETNPNQVDEAALREWKAAGINRLSIGCQSFQPRMLQALRRNHSAEVAIEAVERALSSIGNVSLDVMYGGPDQGLEEWERDLDQLARFEGLGHVSAYNLTVEPNTAFWTRRKRGSLRVTDEDTCAMMMELLVERCTALGIEQYEVSSFAREGARSQHNSNYWVGGEYLGLGMGAHGLQIDAVRGVLRRNNARKLAHYMRVPLEAAEIEEVSAHAHLLERLFLGVRTGVGLDFDEVCHQFEHAVDAALLEGAAKVLEVMVAEELLVFDGVYRPTAAGFQLADSLAERIYDALG